MRKIVELAEYRASHSPPLSQGELAHMLGVTTLSVARWETGTRRVDPDLVPRIVHLTGIPKEKLRPDLAAIFGARP